MTRCPCAERHTPRRIVLTGGPGAGKTAVLELVRRALCEHVKVLAEAASVVYGGGFPRGGAPGVRDAGQRAIFYVQRELERAAMSENPAIVLCDRGTVDGAAYCASPDDFFHSVGTTLEEQLARYDLVVRLRTPSAEQGYNHRNPLRTEAVEEALALDRRIGEVWVRHPRVVVIDNAPDFLTKASRALDVIRDEVPNCCRAHFSVGAAGRSCEQV